VNGISKTQLASACLREAASAKAGPFLSSLIKLASSGKLLMNNAGNATRESIIEKTYCSENLPPAFVPHGRDFAQAGRPSLPSGPEALWAGGQRGVIPPFVKGGKEGFSFWCLYNYGLISNKGGEKALVQDLNLNQEY
jgi:hypothetical protein